MTEKLVSLITYSELPALDPDDQILKQELEKLACEVRIAVWDDPGVDWQNAGLCVLRSTWDYHKKYDQFCLWLDHVSSQSNVFNHPKLLRWNSDKSYLKELRESGAPIIPTFFQERKKRESLQRVFAEMNWAEAVIKPAIGLASWGAKRIKSDSLEEGERHLDLLLAGGAKAMVQEFLPSVYEYGERALVFINGKYSHCVRKAAFQKLAVAGQAGETEAIATESELETAAKILSCLKTIPLYARVDLVKNNFGESVLMELELVEPSLFLSTNPKAGRLFAEAIVEKLASN